MRSPELAELVSNLLQKEISSGNVRVLVHRARERFAEILIELVRDSLASTDAETLEHELIDLNLWQYCKPLLRSGDDD
jgi:RNA polymerase sigma-70 factor (ECF subfamily)